MRAFIMLPALALALIACATATENLVVSPEESFSEADEESFLVDDKFDDKKKMSSTFVDADSTSLAFKTRNYAKCARSSTCTSGKCAYNSRYTQSCKPKAGFAVGKPCYYSADCAGKRTCSYDTAKTLACKPKAGFALGKPCYYSADCKSKLCGNKSHKCKGRGENYASCKHHADCSSGYCRYAGDFANCSVKKGACKCMPAKDEFADDKGCYWSSDCNSSWCGAPKKAPASGGKYVCFRRRRIPAGSGSKRPSPERQTAPKDPCKKYKAQKKADQELAKTLKQTVRFQPGRTVLTNSGKEILKKIAKTLNKNPWMDITVEGHSTASGNWCKTLTTGRAKTSSDYLQKTLKCKNKMALKQHCRTFVGLKIKSAGGARNPPRGCV